MSPLCSSDPFWHIGAGSPLCCHRGMSDPSSTLTAGVAIMAAGQIVAAGPMEQVRQGRPLEDRFVQLVGAQSDDVESRLAWLGTSSD